MKIQAAITRKQLTSLSKGKLIDIVKSMENYLVSMVNVNDEMYWKGRIAPEHKQACVTRETAFKGAATMLQTFVDASNKEALSPWK